jgi:hypothetical protein
VKDWYAREDSNLGLSSPIACPQSGSRRLAVARPVELLAARLGRDSTASDPTGQPAAALGGVFREQSIDSCSTRTSGGFSAVGFTLVLRVVWVLKEKNSPCHFQVCRYTASLGLHQRSQFPLETPDSASFAECAAV